MSTATLRGARAVAIVCAVLFFVPTVLSFVYPNAFLYAPHQIVYERMLGAVLAALGLSLLLSMRDPVRNAGVYAVVGLVAGTVDASAIYSLVVDGGDVAHWLVQVPLLGAIAALLVVTYTRLRRPHPVVVRVVIAAVVLLPVALLADDAATAPDGAYRRLMDAIVSVRDLRKRYGQIEAVAGVSFDVRQGEIFALLGPNGAGKTTTVEILEGLREADGGSAIVAGVDVTKDPSGVKQRIGVQLQQSAFPENFLAKEIVDLFALFYGKRVEAMALLRAVGLEDKAGQKSEKLSGGQRQRLSIAVAMVNDPQVLFLDEPTTGLDPQARRNLWELIRDIRARGTTVFLTTHYLDEAEVLCDRVGIMDAGKIIALDSPRSLIAQLLGRGFSKPVVQQQANLEDVFLDLTGHELRED